MDEKNEDKYISSHPLYELRSICSAGNVHEVIKFIQDEFIVSRQTAKKMLETNTLLVYHLSKEEAEEHIERYKRNGLICKHTKMTDE